LLLNFFGPGRLVESAIPIVQSLFPDLIFDENIVDLSFDQQERRTFGSQVLPLLNQKRLVAAAGWLQTEPSGPVVDQNSQLLPCWFKTESSC
jgi:hypothetical protein